ncbi:MAG: OadG-related small transporter subunit [Clostridiaceae bacterium]|nr:OadG-related small transporter subunit [Clostridiaceae bacterium]
MSYDLIASLNIMWQGMLGIFVVMVIISLIVKLLAKITK